MCPGGVSEGCPGVFDRWGVYPGSCVGFFWSDPHACRPGGRPSCGQTDACENITFRHST